MLRFPTLFKRCSTAAVILLSHLLTGCTGDLGATDGGVPLGSPRGTFTGVVVQAAHPGTSVQGAILTLSGTGGDHYLGESDATGTYMFSGVTLGPATLTVSPPAGSGLAAQVIPLAIAADSQRIVVAALGSGAQYAAATAVSLSPSALQLSVGQSADLSASVSGSGVTAGSVPSLTVSGGVGQIFPGGHFVATHRGSGTITAVFGPLSISIPVTVL